MSPVEMIKRSVEDGVHISVSPTGGLKVIGAESLVAKWVHIFLPVKSQVLAELQKNALLDLVKNGGSAWRWKVLLPDQTLIVATMPASTLREMIDMYADAIDIHPLEE